MSRVRLICWALFTGFHLTERIRLFLYIFSEIYVESFCLEQKKKKNRQFLHCHFQRQNLTCCGIFLVALVEELAKTRLVVSALWPSVWDTVKPQPSAGQWGASLKHLNPPPQFLQIQVLYSVSCTPMTCWHVGKTVRFHFGCLLFVTWIFKCSVL